MAAPLFIFGAGASFGAGAANPKPPPLGADLYPVLERLYTDTWGSLAERYKTALRADFEAGMELVAEERPQAPAPLQRAMASFFFGFTPLEGNLYLSVARRIHDSQWGGALVTLNYERLLELSLAAESVRPLVGGSTVGGSSVELCLPHGCCHIFCEGIAGSAKAVSFAATAITTGGTATVIADPREFARRITRDAFPPVMSYFTPSKFTTSCVNFIQAQRKRYEDLVASADVIAIVGVKVRPHDSHLWSALGTTPAQLTYCSGSSAGREFETWAAGVRAAAADVVLSGYFGDCFEELCARVGL